MYVVVVESEVNKVGSDEACNKKMAKTTTLKHHNLDLKSCWEGSGPGWDGREPWARLRGTRLPSEP